MRRILPIGYDFLKQWEQGPRNRPGVRLTPEGAALDAYQCSANKWTIGFGCTVYSNGKAVKQGDKITPEDVQPLLEYNLRRFEELVDGLLTSKASSLMFSAHVLLAFNIGPGNYRTSSALRETNAGSTVTEWRNAVENFFLFTGVTTYSPSKSQLADPSFASKIGRDKDGDPIWVSPNGRPCGFMLRSRGLLKRHMGGSLFALGYDWRQATTDSERLRIQITIRHPDTAYFDESRNRWVSRVDMDETTDFDKVLAIAKDYPLDLSVLSPSALAESEEAGPGVSPEEAPEPVPETIPKPVASNPPQHKEAAPVAENIVIDVPVGDPNKPIILVPTEHVFDKTLDPKPIELSDTFKYAVTELVGVWLKNTAGKTGVVGSFATLAWPLYQSMAQTPEAQMVLTWVIVSAVSASVGGLGWAAGKVIETAGIKGKEQARADGVQLKY